MKSILLAPALIALLTVTACTISPFSPDTAMTDAPTIIFEDDMTENWQDNWFLDGKEGEIRNNEEGLFLAGGPVTKWVDRELYHAHHVVLWTKQVFEGDIRIQYEMTRNDEPDTRSTTLLYIQAQGIGTPEFPNDISEYNAYREEPGMDRYFNTMDLLSLSFRGELRLKRYPWRHDDGSELSKKPLIEPMGLWNGIQIGPWYHVDVTKKGTSLRALVTEMETGTVIIDQTWDTRDVDPELEPQLITKGRIGIRHMASKKLTYRNVSVEQL